MVFHGGLGLEWVQVVLKGIKERLNRGPKGSKGVQRAQKGVKVRRRGSKESMRWSLSVTIFVTCIYGTS